LKLDRPLRYLGTIAVVATLLLSGCAATKPVVARYRSFVPPVLGGQKPEPVAVPDLAVPETASVQAPSMDPAIPRGTLPPRPSNPQFLREKADRLYAAGKRALQESRPADARRDFDEAILTLMSDPLPDDPVERRLTQDRLEDLTDAIYHYDLDSLGAGIGAANDTGEKEALQPPPVEKQILEETLPVNPSIRERVREQIENTMSELPLELTDAVLGYIDYFSTDRGKRVLLSGFARAGRYRDMILETFREYGLPEELIFVAQLESHFNPSAVSYASAVGMWQFMSFTGDRYDLRINGTIDERRDPASATRAAAKYLKDLYLRYGDWYLAMAAYNCGEGCVDRSIQRTGYADFWDLRRLQALPLATTNYVPEILAMVIMYKNADEYGLVFDPDSPLEFEQVAMEAETNLALIADAIDRPEGQLRQMNPALVKGSAPGGYRVHLPVGASDDLRRALAIVPAPLRKTVRLHRVDEGDTLADLAKRFSTTPAKIAELNNGRLPKLGTFAMIPPPTPVKAKKKSRAKVTQKSAPKASTPKTAVAKGKAAKRAAKASATIRKPATKSKPRG
jgi:membrane-bound lytic murein transglycosylase D